MSILGMLAPVAGAAAGALGIGQKRQLKQQQKLNDQQEAATKRLQQQQADLQYDMWNKTNYAAQVAHLKEAGLNPGLLYGKGGAGGATTGSIGMGSVGGGQAEEPSKALGIGAQTGMMVAQQALIAAQTKKIEAETAKISGVDTEKAETEIQSLTQGIENAKQVQKLNEVQERLTRLNGDLVAKTMDATADRIYWEANKTMSEASSALTEAYISNEVREEKVKIIQQEALSGVLRNILLKSEKEVNDQKIKQMAESIMQGWHQIAQGDSRIAIEKFKNEIQANYPNLLNAIGRGFDDTIELIFKGVGGREQYKRIE